MTSIKRLRSVIQSTAHHAMSGLCYVHPHLGEECKKIGIKAITFNLLDSAFEPKSLTVTNELKLSTNALKEKFIKLISIEGIEVSDIEDAHITFQFIRGRWPSGCYIRAITRQGKTVDMAIDSTGRKADVLHESS